MTHVAEPNPSILRHSHSDTDWQEAQRLIDERAEARLPQLYSFLWPSLVRWARRISPGDAEDIAQETLLLLHSKAASEPILNVRGWLRCVVRNLGITALRRRKRVRGMSADEAVRIPARDEWTSGAACREEQGRLADFLSRLPVRLRLVLTAIYVEGKSVDEVANSMGRTRRNVRRLLDRGIALLRSQAGSPHR